MKTMIYIILDRSGSMMGKEADVIGGVNTFIVDQKKLKDPASIAFVRFDTDIERFRPMQALEKVEPLTDAEYTPRGCTSLLDAVGGTINAAEKDWVIEQPDRAIMVIVTDGQENSSREFRKEKIKELITAREKSGLWAFIYLGANVDAFAEASSLGINLSNTAGYHNTSKGIGSTYTKMSQTVGKMRATGATVADYSDLGGMIEEDGSVTKSGKINIGSTPTDPAAAIKAKIDAQGSPPPSYSGDSQGSVFDLPWTPPTGGGGTDGTWKTPS